MNEKMNKFLKSYSSFQKLPPKRYTFTRWVLGAELQTLQPIRIKHRQFASQEQIPWMVLSNASNNVSRGQDSGGLSLCLIACVISVDGYVIEAEAVLSIDTTHVACCIIVWKLESLQWHSGSIGGAVFMNAEFMGGEIAHVLVSMSLDQRRREIKNSVSGELAFGYRHSKRQACHLPKFCFVTRQSRANPSRRWISWPMRQLKQPLRISLPNGSDL